MRRINHRSYRAAAGFTILELMMASGVFSITLLVLAVGVTSFTNTYYKGITGSKTQAATRAIMSTIVQSIQFGKSITVLSGAGGAGGLCADNTLYAYQLGQQVTDTTPQAGLHQGYHGLVVATGADCTAATPAVPTAAVLPAGSRELLGQHMRLGALTITPSGNLYTIRVRVIYGDDDLLLPAVSGSTDWSQEICSGQAGSSFCAVSDLATTVERRLL